MPKFAGWNSPAKVKRVLQATLYLASKRRREDLELPPSEPTPDPGDGPDEQNDKEQP